MARYHFERQPFFKSVPCEPVEVRKGLVLDTALAGVKEGEDLITGDFEAKTLRSAKGIATRESGLSGAGGKWKKQWHPRREEMCHVKDNGFNLLYLWESETGDQDDEG